MKELIINVVGTPRELELIEDLNQLYVSPIDAENPNFYRDQYALKIQEEVAGYPSDDVFGLCYKINKLSLLIDTYHRIRDARTLEDKVMILQDVEKHQIIKNFIYDFYEKYAIELPRDEIASRIEKIAEGNSLHDLRIIEKRLYKTLEHGYPEINTDKTGKILDIQKVDKLDFTPQDPTSLLKVLFK